MNAILNKNSFDVRGCTVYVALFPCNECAKLIIQAGIAEVVYFSDKHKNKRSTVVAKIMFDTTKIKYRQYEGGRTRLDVWFDKIGGPAQSSPLSKTSVNTGSCYPVRKETVDCPPLLCRAPGEYIAWEEYFMAMTFLSALRGKDPVSMAGACIVNKKNRIVGTGYHSMPSGFPADLSSVIPKAEEELLMDRNIFICHAEVNAVFNKNCESLTGCTMYTSRFPCNECAKIIIQAGISDVIYYSLPECDWISATAAKRMFDQAGVSYKEYRTEMTIDFTCIDL